MNYPIVGVPTCGRRNPSPYHTHPRTKYPVTRHQMEMQLHELYGQAGLPGDPILNWPNALTRLHEREPRRYAQVYAPTGPELFAGRGHPRFELAEQARWLPRAHRRGLLAHEVGHVLAPEGSETAADRAALEHLGVKIGYDRRWPGKGLQVARRGNPGIQPGIWTAELASRVTPDSESGFPRLGDDAAEISGYAVRLKGDAIDQVLQAISQGGEGNRRTAEYLAEATRLSVRSVRRALRHLQTKVGRYPFVVSKGQETVGGRNRQIYEVQIHGAQAASWERQAAAQSAGMRVEESEPEDFALAQERSLRADKLRIAARKRQETVDFYDWSVIEQPPFLLIQCKFRPFAPNAEARVVGELWLRLGPGDDRDYSGVSSGYASVAHVHVDPSYRRRFVATHLYELAAEAADRRGLRLSSGLDLSRAESAFWIKQIGRQRATPMTYQGKELSLTRFMLDRPPPPGLHNPRLPRGYSLEPTIGPTLRHRR